MYTNKLIACTGTGSHCFFCSDVETLQRPWLALPWGLWQHNILFVTCEWNFWISRNISFFLPDTITTFPSCLFHNSPQFFSTLFFFFSVSLFIAFLVFLHPVLHYIPSFHTFFLYILYLSSALPQFSLLASHPPLLPWLSVTGFTFISPPPASLPLCLSLSQVWWQRSDMIWFNFSSSSATP